MAIGQSLFIVIYLQVVREVRYYYFRILKWHSSIVSDGVHGDYSSKDSVAMKDRAQRKL